MMRLDDPYLTDQLIPYIGNKRKLLPLIYEAIKKTGIESGTFFDVFSGSGVVARLAKMAGYKVIANDWEPYSKIINKAYIETNTKPAFQNLGGMENAIATLNALPSEPGYIATHYCPADDEEYDIAKERMFYTQENGQRIDTIREQIKAWRDNEQINESEEIILLAPLIYQASYCSNTSGVFKGFHNGWGGATKTAWYRIKSHLSLDVPMLRDNKQSNLVYQEDALALSDNIRCDIAYLDPPYNQHQYGANYHLLNTIALWDKPKINRYISDDGTRDKAAIRLDWRTDRRSAYCYKATALDEFKSVIEKLQAKYILVSYSTDGIISVDDMLTALSSRGPLDVVIRKYKRYRVSSQRPSPTPHTTEFVAIVNTQEPGRQGDVDRTVKEIIAGVL